MSGAGTRVLLDTNVVLDLLLDRTEFAEHAQAIFAQVEGGLYTGLLCATTLTTVHYLASKSGGKTGARRQIDRLLQIFEVAPVNRAVLEAAVLSPIADFEDAVLCEAALHAQAGALVTRNARDFRKAGLPIYAPLEWLAAGR